MRRRFLCFGLITLVIAIALSSQIHPLFGQDADSKDLIVGTWKLNLEKSFVNRKGVQAHPTRPSTRVYAVEGDGYRVSIFDGGATMPTRSYFAKFDGKEYPDPRTAGRGEVGIHYRLSPFMSSVPNSVEKLIAYFIREVMEFFFKQQLFLSLLALGSLGCGATSSVR
jgi:hypothetical protein